MAKRGSTAAKKPRQSKSRSRKRGAKDEGPTQEQVKNALVQKARQIGEQKFNQLVRQTKNLKKQNREIAKNIADLVTSAVENHNLDKPAFDIFRKLAQMSPQKRMTTLACFDYYREIGKLDEDETGQGEMSIPRPEAGAKAHLRTVAEGGTRVDDGEPPKSEAAE